MCERQCRKPCNLRSAAEELEETGSNGRARRYRKRGSPKPAAEARSMETDPSPVRLWSAADSEGHSEGYGTAYSSESEEMARPPTRAHTAPEPSLEHDAEALKRPARARRAPVARHTEPTRDSMGDTPMAEESEEPETVGCCGPNTRAQAPDGTGWQVGCPEWPRRTVCQWKVDQDDPGQQQGAAYKKLEQHPDPAAAAAAGPDPAAAGPDPAAAAAGPAAGRAGAGDGGVVHLGVGKQKLVDMSDADSFADVPPAVPPVATSSGCHPRPFAGHWQENVIRQHTHRGALC